MQLLLRLALPKTILPRSARVVLLHQAVCDDKRVRAVRPLPLYDTKATRRERLCGTELLLMMHDRVGIDRS